LLQCDGAGTPISISTTTTAADGSYSFGPASGPDNVCLDPFLTYQVVISNLPAGYMNSTGAGSGCVGDEDDSPMNNGESGCYNPSNTDVADGDSDEHIDFGIFKCEEIGGEVFVDENNNGCQDASETTMVEGAMATLWACDPVTGLPSTAIDSMLTLADGSYSFGGQDPISGSCILDASVTYIVAFDVPTDIGETYEGYTFSSPVADAACMASGASDDVDFMTGQS